VCLGIPLEKVVSEPKKLGRYIFQLMCESNAVSENGINGVLGNRCIIELPPSIVSIDKTVGWGVQILMVHLLPRFETAFWLSTICFSSSVNPLYPFSFVSSSIASRIAQWTHSWTCFESSQSNFYTQHGNMRSAQFAGVGVYFSEPPGSIEAGAIWCCTNMEDVVPLSLLNIHAYEITHHVDCVSW